MGLFTKLWQAADVTRAVGRIIDDKLRETVTVLRSFDELTTQKAALSEEVAALKRVQETLSSDIERERVVMKDKRREYRDGHERIFGGAFEVADVACELGTKQEDVARLGPSVEDPRHAMQRDMGRRESFALMGLAALSLTDRKDAALAELQATTPDVLNVKSFGAMGDGTTDDTVAIQAALDAANLSGSGASLVFIPRGVFVVSGLTIGSQVTLAGTGWGSLLLHKANSTAPMITTDDPALTTQVCIRNLLLDGNKRSQTTAVDAINLDSTGMDSGRLVRHRLYDLYIRSVKGDGVVTDFPGRQTFVANVNCHNVDGYAFHLDGAESHITDCIAQSTGLQGFFIQGDRMTLVGCRSGESGIIDATDGGDGYLLKNATRCSLVNCISDSNPRHGFHFWGQSGDMEGPMLANCSSTNDNQTGNGGNGFQFTNVVRSQGFGLKVMWVDGDAVEYGVNFSGTSAENRIFISSHGHQMALMQRNELDNIVNGLGYESAGAETPTAANWTAGDIVDFTDSGDASGDGIYILGRDGATWTRLVDNAVPQVLTGAGAVDLVSAITHIVTTGSDGDDALTLADGAEGERKSIVMKTKLGTDSAVLTPTNLGNGSTLTFDTVGDSAELLFTNSAWHFVGGTATLA